MIAAWGDLLSRVWDVILCICSLKSFNTAFFMEHVWNGLLENSISISSCSVTNSNTRGHKNGKKPYLPVAAAVALPASGAVAHAALACIMSCAVCSCECNSPRGPLLVPPVRYARHLADGKSNLCGCKLCCKWYCFFLISAVPLSGCHC